MSENSQCQATRKDGHPCVQPAKQNGWCWAHNPAFKEIQREGGRKGGRNKATVKRLEKAMPPRMERLYQSLEGAFARVANGDYSPQQGQALAALGRAMATVWQHSELEQRVAQLEKDARDTAKVRQA